MAGFVEADGGGAVLDFDAPRNAPAKSPGLHADKVLWHSLAFQYELVADPVDVTVSHPAMSGTSTRLGVPPSSLYSGSVYIDVFGAVGATNHTLVTHNLGYVPLAFVAYQGRMLTAGTIVQQGGNGQQRWVSAYATASIIGLRESRITSSLVGNDTLAAASRTYTVLIFKETAIDPDLPLFGKVGGRIVGARGRLDTDKRYLRRTGAGDSPFDIDLDRVIDLGGGRVRVTTGGNVVTEAGYTGSYAGGAFVPVGA